MTPDNKIINGLWISPDGKPLSDLERLCIYSFCANGHDFHLWTYGDLPNIPRDTSPGKVEVRDGNEILSADKMFYVRRSLAGFSDWFRWELMRKIGGWYADMDTVCLRPLSLSDEIVMYKDSPDGINCSVMKFPKGHYFAEALADACEHPGRIVPWDTPKRRLKKTVLLLKFWKNAHEKQGWGGAGGPEPQTLAARHFGIFQDTKPFWMSHFIPWNFIACLFNEDLHDAGVLSPLLSNAHTIHFCSKSMGNTGLKKNGIYHPNSAFEILKRRYLPELRE